MPPCQKGRRLLQKSSPLMLASHNPGKLSEFQFLLRDLAMTLVAYPERGEIVAETGTTYQENAALKAHAVARTQGVYALADDSGVEVDALDGAPGVHSARFVSDDPWTNTREILVRLMDVPWEKRTARMRSVLCLASPDGQEWFFEGVLEGYILGWPRGNNGFGVDPVFSVDGSSSLAELPPDEKNRISHRALAAMRFGQFWSGARDEISRL